jgi:hypothetical protein
MWYGDYDFPDGDRNGNLLTRRRVTYSPRPSKKALAKAVESAKKTGGDAIASLLSEWAIRQRREGNTSRPLTLPFCFAQALGFTKQPRVILGADNSITVNETVDENFQGKRLFPI